MPATSVVAIAAPLVADAAARGIRAPVCLVGADGRDWVVVERGPGSRARDALLLDEFGDLWWGRLEGRGSARVTRPCWPEEAPEYLEPIRALAARLEA